MQHIRNGISVTYAHPPDANPEVPYGSLPEGALLINQISRVLLRTVEDRGDTYEPPQTHLGQPIPDTEWHAREVGNLAVNYLSARLAEAETKFLPKA
jgi:hypothetical protein